LVIRRRGRNLRPGDREAGAARPWGPLAGIRRSRPGMKGQAGQRHSAHPLGHRLADGPAVVRVVHRCGGARRSCRTRPAGFGDRYRPGRQGAERNLRGFPD